MSNSWESNSTAPKWIGFLTTVFVVLGTVSTLGTFLIAVFSILTSFSDPAISTALKEFVSRFGTKFISLWLNLARNVGFAIFLNIIACGGLFLLRKAKVNDSKFLDFCLSFFFFILWIEFALIFLPIGIFLISGIALNFLKRYSIPITSQQSPSFPEKLTMPEQGRLNASHDDGEAA